MSYAMWRGGGARFGEEAQLRVDGAGVPGKRALTDRLGNGPLNARGGGAEGEAQASAGAASSPTQTGEAAWIVSDGAPLMSGQMSRTAFLAQLRTAARSAAASGARADKAAGPDASEPTADRWVQQHAGDSAAALEHAIAQFTRRSGVTCAADYIPAFTMRLRETIESGAGHAAPDHGPGGAAAGGAVPTSLAGQLANSRSSAVTVPGHIAHAFGGDFGNVRIHTGGLAERMAEAQNARAFTVGSDVVMARGEFRPGTLEGDALIAHELAHVQQQSGGGGASGGAEHEQDADRAASGVLGRLHGRGGSTPHNDKGSIGAEKRSGIALQRCKDGSGGGGGGKISVGAVKTGADARLALTKSATVAVTMTGLPADKSVDFDVDGSGGAAGKATVTAGASLKANGNVTVRADAQTAAGSAGGLAIRAKVDGTEVGRSPGFTVASWPEKYTDVFASDLDGPAVGVVVQDGWSSDGGGGVAELDQVKIWEQVGLGHKDNPPFTIAGGTTDSSGTSDYLDATKLSQDRHGYPKAGIVTTGLDKKKSYTVVFTQLCVFKCARTGVVDRLMPDSGYTITHTVWWDGGKKKWQHKCVKVGAAATVGAFSATAGAGNAPSLVHDL